ncbi:hypothetical protein F4776DRAFT_631174 [Hypoxylon sp. NC0597]|nr:hypothetical protein F4776DRAFT_631174 [Hypoxylon sp. NC0597]
MCDILLELNIYVSIPKLIIMIGTITKRRSPRLHTLDLSVTEDRAPSHTHLHSKRRRDSNEEDRSSLVKKSKLGRPCQQQPTPNPSHISHSSADHTEAAASSPSTVSSWLKTFDSDPESNVSVSKSLAQPPSDHPEDPPSDFEDLELKSISSIAETSSDNDTSDMDDSKSYESNLEDYRSLVCDPLFRVQRLSNNRIYLRKSIRDEPEDVATVLNAIKSTHDYPEPPADEFKQLASLTWGDEADPPKKRRAATASDKWDAELAAVDEGSAVAVNEDVNIWVQGDDQDEMGVGLMEDDVKSMFDKTLLDCPLVRQKEIKITKKTLIDRHAIPSLERTPATKLPALAPDTLFGYPRTFLPGYPIDETMAAQANDSLSYPFLTMELASGGNCIDSLWVATNQCILGCVACSNIAGRLSDLMVESGQPPLTTTAFGITTNGSEVRFFVSWREKCRDNEFQYIVCFIDDFLLRREADYMKFRMYLFNVFKWGLKRKQSLVAAIQRKYGKQPIEDSASLESSEAAASLIALSRPRQNRRRSSDSQEASAVSSGRVEKSKGRRRRG